MRYFLCGTDKGSLVFKSHLTNLQLIKSINAEPILKYIQKINTITTIEELLAKRIKIVFEISFNYQGLQT